MQARRVPGKRGILASLPAEHVLVFRPALGKRVKAEFGYDDRKGVGVCDRGPLGLGRYIAENSYLYKKWES